MHYVEKKYAHITCVLQILYRMASTAKPSRLLHLMVWPLLQLPQEKKSSSHSCVLECDEVNSHYNIPSMVMWSNIHFGFKLPPIKISHNVFIYSHCGKNKQHIMEYCVFLYMGMWSNIHFGLYVIPMMS